MAFQPVRELGDEQRYAFRAACGMAHGVVAFNEAGAYVVLLFVLIDGAFDAGLKRDFEAGVVTPLKM